LDKFSVKIHQLSPNSFLEVSKFLWIVKTFGCNFSTDVFARFRLTTPAALSILAGRIHERGLREFRSRLAARPTSQKIGALTGFM
jgi:hypothetical protein